MDYDGGYHKVFSNPKMMVELVQSFVNEPWVEHLDFSSIERENAKFHSEWFSRRESDIIYKVKLLDGQEIYLYLILEFQSEINKWMAVRVNAYVSLLYQQLITEEKLIHELLPPVFPIVLYNAKKPWKKPTGIRELIALPKESPLWRWQPDMKFFLIEEWRYTGLHPHNMVEALFALENSTTPGQAQKAVHTFSRLAQEYKQPILDAMRQFIVFVIELKIGVKLDEKQSVQEIDAMLETTVKEWEEEKKSEGIQEGMKAGESSLLKRLLTQRFGPLPEWVLVKIQNADLNTIDQWGLKLLDASNLEEVFD